MKLPVKGHPVYRLGELALTAVILVIVLAHDAPEHATPGIDLLDLVQVVLGGKLAAGAFAFSKG